tara:strand:+ start:130 stop:531 length:402 start_codon:yes stop_codon:yes gene_type:complete
MPSSPRSDGKYNRQAQYFLCSVKDRNLLEFLGTLKQEKRRHAEPKADHITALGVNQRHTKSPVDLDELFYFLNSYNEMEEGGTYYLRRLKKIIMEQIEKDYEEMGKTVKDLRNSYFDKQDNFWDEVYKNGVDL